MKRNVLLKIILTVGFLSTVFNLFAASQHGFEKKETTIYVNSIEQTDVKNLYFFKSYGKIPFVDITEMLCAIGGTDYCSGKAEGNIYTITRKNNAVCKIDIKNKIIHFDDYDLFNKFDYAVTLLDIVNDFSYISHEAASFEMNGDSIDIEYSTYNIEIFIDDNKCLMPLQTFNDIFTSHWMAAILYNGNELFYVNSDFCLRDSDGYTELGEQYYKVEPSKIDKNFADYNYRELVLNMQLHYGLKNFHDIEKFSDWFHQHGLDNKLSSTDPVDSDYAIISMCEKYLGDLHSSHELPSPFSGKDVELKVDVRNPSLESYIQSYYENIDLRKSYFPKGIPGVQKVGNTVYVTFDHFTRDFSRDYFEEPITGEEYYDIIYDYPDSGMDTYALIHVANDIIKSDPKIRNVVIDLSCNGGGNLESAVFTACWLLGRANLSIKNNITGCRSSISYTADINFDGEYNQDDDCISDKRLFILGSENTFSCANLLVAIMADSGKATLIGSKTGGGACAVYLTSTATGTLFKTSSHYQMSSQKNGIFTSIDDGIAPDYKLTEKQSFYNRSKKGLTGFIEKLY